jgi:hypothetical protein
MSAGNHKGADDKMKNDMTTRGTFGHGSETSAEYRTVDLTSPTSSTQLHHQ